MHWLAVLVSQCGKETMKTEKQRRIYYQNIVYHVCNALDRIDGNLPGYGIVCGTADQPSYEVEARMTALAEEVAQLRTANKALTGKGLSPRQEGTSA